MRAKANVGVVLGAVALFAALVVLGAAVTRVALGVNAASLLPEASTAEASQRASDESLPSLSADAGVTPPHASGTFVGEALRWDDDASIPSEVLSLAVERAPFDPDRQPPAQRYLLPDQIEPPRREMPPPERPAPPQFRILGTAVAPTGSVAVVQLADGATRVMTVGQEMGGYRLSAIESGAVVMSGRGWDLTFAVADAQPIGANRPQRDANGRIIQQERGQENRRPQDRAVTAALNARAAVLERLRLRGDVEVDMMNNGRAVIMGPNGERREIAIPLSPPNMPGTTYQIRRPAPPGGGG